MLTAKMQLLSWSLSEASAHVTRCVHPCPLCRMIKEDIEDRLRDLGDATLEVNPQGLWRDTLHAQADIVHALPMPTLAKLVMTTRRLIECLTSEWVAVLA